MAFSTASSMEGEYDHLPEQAFYMVGSIEEAVVLTGDAYDRFESLAGLELFDERTHFYRLGSCAENEHYLFHVKPPCRGCFLNYNRFSFFSQQKGKRPADRYQTVACLLPK